MSLRVRLNNLFKNKSPEPPAGESIPLAPGTTDWNTLCEDSDAPKTTFDDLASVSFAGEDVAVTASNEAEAVNNIAENVDGGGRYLTKQLFKRARS